MKKACVFVGALVLAASAAPFGQQAPPQPPPQTTPVFRSSVNLVLVDVVVRDKNGAVVKGLKMEDFDLLEDGMRQQIVTFASEEIGTSSYSEVYPETVAARTPFR